MKIKTHLFVGFLLIGCFYWANRNYFIFRLEETSEHLDLLDNNLEALKKSEKLLPHANKIQYYDGVNTICSKLCIH